MSKLATAAVVTLALALIGCSGSPSASIPAATPTLAPPASFGPPSSPGASVAASVAVDKTLLSVLPPFVDGVPVQESSLGESDAMGTADLPSIASAIVAAVAVDTGTSDLVYALVVRLRPDGLTDATFRDWRDSWDEGACGSATNVVGNAQVPIAGRTIFIGTCASGLHTYHVWIADHGLIISASSSGTRRLGELLFGDLRP